MLFSFPPVAAGTFQKQGTEEFVAGSPGKFFPLAQSFGQRRQHRMNYELDHQDDYLIIKLSGVARPNERLLIKKSLESSLRPSDRKVIVDLRNLESGDAVYFVGMLKTIQKEVQLIGGKMKLCSVPAAVIRYFQENRLERMFEVAPSIEKAKGSFIEERDGREPG